MCCATVPWAKRGSRADRSFIMIGPQLPCLACMIKFVGGRVPLPQRLTTVFRRVRMKRGLTCPERASCCALPILRHSHF